MLDPACAGMTSLADSPCATPTPDMLPNPCQGGAHLTVIQMLLDAPEPMNPCAHKLQQLGNAWNTP